VAIKIPRAMTVANLIMNVSVIGATLTTGENIASIYSPTGTLIASTADQSTVWTSLGLKVMALTAAGGQSLLLPAGYVLAGPLAKGTTAPQFSDAAVSAAAAVALNANLTSPLLRSGYAGTGTYTAPPSTLPTVTGQGGTMWAALS